MVSFFIFFSYAAIGLGRTQALSIALKNKQHRKILEPKGTCENEENTQLTVKECTSICFVKKIVESQECGCIPAWGLDFCDMLNLEDKTCDFQRSNNEGSFVFLNDNFGVNYEPESHDDHRKKRTNIVKECRFSDFMKKDCYDFITNLKQNLNSECNLTIPFTF